ncbi:MAG TPA: preprotein translocase subunit SecE [Candidatus Acidoferrales bacterium]|nr:preprotein translocase subunit SecE [Candidatus Acidoferrales bacterium]
MNVEVESPNRVVESVKWLAVAALVGVGMVGFYYFSQWLLILRILIFMVFVGGALFVGSRTHLGGRLVSGVADAVREARKVVWPTRAETMQTTLVVIGMVLLMGVMLWMVDWLLGFILRRLTGMGA